MLQSTVHCRRGRAVYAGLSLSLSLVLGAGPASAAPLQPFKDDLFAYRTIVETAEGGALRIVDYREARDLKGRDQTPERRAKPPYVTTGVNRVQENIAVQTDAGPVEVALTGRASNAAFSVIFIHGRGGDRRLGNNDWTFGGNFNRLKNLAARNGGAYYAPTVRSFDEKGTQAIAGLIGSVAALSPGKPIVLACASMGSFICWGIARKPTAVKSLAGMVIMGGAPDVGYPTTPAFKAKLPVFFTHGDLDTVYQANDQIALFRKLRRAGVPSQFVLFQTGTHGTPIRMTDWRETLNWVLSR